MLTDDAKNKIQDVITGTNISWQEDTVTAARNLLCRSFSPGTTVKKDFENQLRIKEKQATALSNYIYQKKCG